MSYREEAIANLVARLIGGQAYDGATTRTIFHDLADDLSSVEYQTLLDILEGVAGLNHKFGDTHTLACRELEGKAQSLIQSYVLTREEWIHEEEARLRAEEPEPELQE